MILPPRMRKRFPELLPGIVVPDSLNSLLVKAADETLGTPGPRYIWLRALYAARESCIDTPSVIFVFFAMVASSSLKSGPRSKLLPQPGYGLPTASAYAWLLMIQCVDEGLTGVPGL